MILKTNNILKIIQSESFFIIFTFIVIFFAYSPTLKNDFIWDDDMHVTKNFHLETLSGLSKIWKGQIPQYYPLTHTSFWFEYRFFKLNPLGYHLNNILLYFLNILIIYYILKLFFNTSSILRWAVLIYALHPINVESVAWISERKNVLSGLFYYLSLYTGLIFLDLDKNFNVKKSSILKYYAISLTFFIFSLLSKSTSSTLPLVLSLFIWWRNKPFNIKNISLLLPYYLAGLLMGSLTYWWEKEIVLAKGLEFNHNLLEKVFIAARSMFFYFYKILIPYNQSLFYKKWALNINVINVSLSLIIIVSTLFFFIRRNKFKNINFVNIYFFINFIPASGFFNIYSMRYSYVTDHYIYLSALSLIIGTVFYISTINIKKYKLHFLYMTLSIIFFIITFNRSKVFKNSEIIFRDTIHKNNTSWVAYNNLGIILSNKKEFKEAEKLYLQSHKLNLKWTAPLINLSNDYLQNESYEQALETYYKLIKLDPINSNTYFNIGNIYAQLNKLTESKEFLNKAIKLNPMDYMAYNTLGIVFTFENKYDEAKYYFIKGLEIASDSLELNYNLADLYVKLNDYSNAKKYFKKVLTIDPKHSLTINNLNYLEQNK